MFKNYVLSMLDGKPFQTMYEADKGGAGGGGSDDPPGDDPEKKKKDDQTDPPKDDNKVEFSDSQQQFINNLINKTIKDERTKAEKEREKELERQKMDDKQKAEADLKDAQDKIKAFNDRAVGYEIKDVARELGVPAKKLDRFLKLVDRDELTVDESGNVDRSKIESVVKAVLADVPEFKAPETNRGPGEFNGGSKDGAKFTLAQIQAMTAEEVKNNWDDIQKSMSIHNKK